MKMTYQPKRDRLKVHGLKKNELTAGGKKKY